jgi:hypothetical protein
MKITDIIGTGNSVDKSVAMSGKDTVVGVNAQFTLCSHKTLRFLEP